MFGFFGNLAGYDGRVIGRYSKEIRHPSWIAGETNLSDFLTKCTTYHFQQRASCGFVKIPPANVSEVLRKKWKQNKPQVALILVELCCQEDSAMKTVNSAFGYVE